MNLIFKTLILLLSVSSLASAEDLRIFTDARTAIGAARSKNQLIVFFLSNPRDAEQQKIEQSLTEQLRKQSTDFVLVRNDPGSPASRPLFEGRFGKDLKTLPIAVVSDAAGEEVTSYQGKIFLNYEKMLIKARIESGRVTEPDQLEDLRKKLRMVPVKDVKKSDSFLAPMIEEMKQVQIALTEPRTWTLREGDSTFEASLLEARGQSGIFVDAEGNTREVNFVDLSPADIEFLKSVLQPAN